jgi:drug/metabolite transporter (DMT)-like permease
VTRPGPAPIQVVVALLIVYIVWGSTYLAIALMIETLPPLLAASVRFLTAGILMLGFLAIASRWRRVERPRLVHWRSAAIVGLLLLLGGNGGVVLAEGFIPSGMAAVLIATVPIWIAVLDAIVSRRRPSRLALGGLVAGIVGVAVLMAPVEGLDRLDPVGIGLALVAALLWAAGSVYAGRAPLPRSNALGTGMEMVAGGLGLLLVGTLLGELGQADPARFELHSLLAVAYLIVFGSIVAFTAYTWLLANVPVTTAGTYAYVNPIVAVALGAVLLAEPITLRTVIASVVIIGAVVAMVSGRVRARPQPAVEPAAPAPRPAAGSDASLR